MERAGRSPMFDYQDPFLREQDCGNLPGVLEAEVNREARGRYGAFSYRFPNGESCADVCDRMDGFVNPLYRLFERNDCLRGTIAPIICSL